MPSSDSRSIWSPRRSSDYNRSLAAPIRWSHILVAAMVSATCSGARWGTAPGRITWVPYVALGFLIVIVLLPFDRVIYQAFSSFRLGGDLRRELEAAQQYGQGFSTALVATIIWLQDPARRRRLADWAAAFAITGITATVLKMTLGRPRPLLEDPFVVLGPFSAYGLDADVGMRHSWEIWGGISSQLWSMPSSHTAHIAVMAIFVAFTYPRLRYLAFAMIAVVGLARVQTGAHYLTDVVGGAALGLAIAHTTMSFRWGQRGLDAVAALWTRTRPGAKTTLGTKASADPANAREICSDAAPSAREAIAGATSPALQDQAAAADHRG